MLYDLHVAQISDLEQKQGDSEQVSELQREMSEMSSRLESVQRDNQYKDQVLNIDMLIDRNQYTCTYRYTHTTAVRADK